jgi:hypothetical protein
VARLNRKANGAMHNPYLSTTIAKISLAQVPVQLPVRRQNEIALEVAEQAMLFAYDLDNGDLWYRAWKRAEEVRAQLVN